MKSLDSLKINEIEKTTFYSIMLRQNKVVLLETEMGKHISGSINGSKWTADGDFSTTSGGFGVGIGGASVNGTVVTSDFSGIITFDGGSDGVWGLKDVRWLIWHM